LLAIRVCNALTWSGIHRLDGFGTEKGPFQDGFRGGAGIFRRAVAPTSLMLSTGNEERSLGPKQTPGDETG
jgi:hypothetical protein